MTTHLRELLALSRRALARADALLVAAPIGLLAVTGCSQTPPTTDVTELELQTGATSGGGVVEVHTTSAGGGERPERECNVEPVKVTGCGGGHAKLLSSLSECGLELEKEIDDKRCPEFCGDFQVSGCSVSERDGENRVYCHAAHPCLGRMPSRRLRATAQARRQADVDVDAYLAHAARMEAVSVDAFVELGASMERFGAPAAIGAACARAASDEARHASSMECLLRARGGRVRASRTARGSEPRGSAARGSARQRGFDSLEALALHNEREGVVGEAWGAILAAFQAERAADPVVRRTLATIAREELRHAALSARISAWSRKRLGVAARARLDRERAKAVARIARTTTGFPGREGANELGWPSEAERAALVGELAAFFG